MPPMAAPWWKRLLAPATSGPSSRTCDARWQPAPSSTSSADDDDDEEETEEGEVDQGQDLLATSDDDDEGTTAAVDTDVSKTRFIGFSTAPPENPEDPNLFIDLRKNSFNDDTIEFD